MEFLGVGYQEVLVVLVLMLVVVGPERLPEMAYQIGKAVRTMQRYARQVRDEFQEELAFIDEQYRVVKGDLSAAQESFRQESSRAGSELRGLSAFLKSPVVPARDDSEDVPAPAKIAAPSAAPKPPDQPPLIF
jgi:sec-independent protein translocase protein TatB